MAFARVENMQSGQKPNTAPDTCKPIAVGFFAQCVEGAFRDIGAAAEKSRRLDVALCRRAAEVTAQVKASESATASPGHG